VADADFSALKVLILDDVRAARQLLRAILATFNVKDVLEAEDGLSALALLKEFPRNLVITDYSMKPMDGLEFTRRLRAPGNGMHTFVHVLMISAHTEVALIKNAIDAGVSDFMSKPITRATVEQRLKTAKRSQNDAKNIVLL
jgi:two-component system chemotaxis response regulator CheY